MSRHPRFYIWFPLAALVVTLSVAGWILATLTRGQARTLPDRSVIRLEGVTYGKTHSIVQGSRWERLIRAFLSPQAIAQSGMVVMNHTSARPNTLVFWTSVRPPDPGRVPPNRRNMAFFNFYRSLRGMRAVVIDDQGREMEAEVRHSRRYSPFALTPMEFLDIWEVASFPRRSKTVGLRLYTRDARGSYVRAAEFMVGNPTPGPHPTWTPEPLPITRRQGEWEFTLTSLTAGSAPRHGAFSSWRPGTEPRWARASFRVRRSGAPSRAWSPVDVALLDATGNLQPAAARGREEKRWEVTLSFPAGLSPDELAWKLRVEFERRDPPRAAELWSPSGVAVPAPGSVTTANQSVTRHGVTLRLVGIAAARTRMPGSGSIRGYLPTVHVRVSPPEALRRVHLLRATDERDRAIPARHAGYGGNGTRGFGLEIPPGVKRVYLTFAIRESREVEFVAKPVAG